MKIILVHGIHVSEPAGGIGRLQPHLEAAGLPVMRFDYGHMFAFQTRFKNPELARRLAALAGPEDIIIGHSNGACLAWLAAQQTRVGGLVFINPALDHDAVMPVGVRFAQVYYNAGDHAVQLSRLLLWHPWGGMGHCGATVPDQRVENIDCANTPGLPRIWGHSDIFRYLNTWGPAIAKRVQMRVSHPNRDTQAQ